MCFLFEVWFCPLMTAFSFRNIVLLVLAFLQPRGGQKGKKQQHEKCLCRCLMLM